MVYRVLSSVEQLSTEEESSDSGEEGGSDDELARNLETLLGGRKTTRQLSHEQEELERQELRKLLDKPVSLAGCSGSVPVVADGEMWSVMSTSAVGAEQE